MLPHKDKPVPGGRPGHAVPDVAKPETKGEAGQVQDTGTVQVHLAVTSFDLPFPQP